MGLYVMTPGDIKMPLLFVDNLDSPPMVRMDNSQNSQLLSHELKMFNHLDSCNKSLFSL